MVDAMNDYREDAPGPVPFLTDAAAIEEGLRLGGAGVWRWKIDSPLLEWTRNLESVHHLPPGSFDGSLQSFQLDIHPEDVGQVWEKITNTIATGAPYRAVYRTAPRADAEAIWIETSGGLTIAPDGSKHLTGICHDVSERVRNEHELERRLVQHNAVARFGSFALNERNLQNVLDGAVQIAADVLRAPLTKILQFADTADHLVLRAGIGWADGLIGRGKVGIEQESQAGFTLLQNEPVIVRDLLSDTRFNGPPLLHEHQVRSGISVVIPGSEVRPFGVFGMHTREVRRFDQTDAEFLQSLANIVAGAARQVAAVDHQALLVREMAHRAGNMLQLVSSIAGQTFSSDADAHAARHSFNERLAALARSNYVISRGGWTSTRFVEVVEAALEPFGERVSTKGRDILLPPELCFDMGLVLHELATNSVKYGALGRDEGRTSLQWSIDPRPGGSQTFCLIWDDPSSTSKPSAKGSGFGTKLVSALIERKWSGCVSIAFEPRFELKLEIPVASFSGGGSAQGADGPL
jgi:two-component sensor histidine kinase